MHWSREYIGKPWVIGGRGPDSFDCYGLLVWVYKYHFDIELPPYIEVHSKDLKRVMVLLDRAPELTEWIPVDKPQDGCAVGLSNNQLFHHVGIYLAIDGGILLHAQDRKNVIAQPIATLKAHGWRRVEYFIHKSWL